MSAWQIGSNPPVPRLAGPRRRAEREGSREETQKVGAILTKWIPGDVLAIYIAGVSALAAQAHSKPSVVFLVVVAVLTPAFVVGARWATGEPIKKATWVSAGLGTLAFLIWSLTVPFSGWQRWSLVANNQAGVAICAGIAGILFGLFAEGATRRVTPRASPAAAEGS